VLKTAHGQSQLLTDTYHAAACSARDAMSYEESGVVTAVEVLTAGAYECPLCKRIGNRRLGPNDPRPPFHLGCRCTTVPIV